MATQSNAADDYEGWSVPSKCGHFIHSITDQHHCQLPLAVSLITAYIKQNKLKSKPFHIIEKDVQSHNSQIRTYLLQQLQNIQIIKPLFIQICSLIEAVPIQNHQFYMMSIQLTKISFDHFSMKDRRKCMKYIVIDVT